MIDCFIDIPELFWGFKGEHANEAFGWSVVRSEVCGHEGQSMVIFVLLRHRIAILPVYIHEDRLNYNSSMSMIENLFNILRPSYFYDFFPFPEIVPFVLELILQFAWVIPDGLVIDIFIVDIGGSWAPRCYLRDTDRYSRNSVWHSTEFSWFYLILFC